MNALATAPVSQNSAAPQSNPKLMHRGKYLTGAERSAILMLSLGQEYGAEIWKELDDDEIRAISVAMAGLGTIDSDLVENVLVEFVSQMSTTGALMGNFDSTERILNQFLPKDRVGAIMEEIRGPAGRTMWEKLSNVQEQVLANYLKNEYPQTVAVVLSRIKTEHAARVLAILPEEFSIDVVKRMLAMESIQKDVLERVEQTLRVEFMSSLSQTRRRDAHEQMAEIFNSFDRQTESRFITSLEESDREAADRIKSLMFTFDDLMKLDAAAVQTLLRYVPREKLTVAFKGATQNVRDFFLQYMSQRAGKMLQEEIQNMGPVRLKDVDDAQSNMVSVAKDLAAKGEIMISKNKGDDELVY